MVGKQKKQAQRTKGNTRPSSSSRSAVRLLQVDASLRPAGGFVGLLQQPPDLSEPFSAFGLATAGQLSLRFKNVTSEGCSSPNAESDDGDCRMLMKKMSKKDSITRLKALQEFQAYCITCSEVALISSLPYWPRMFNRLSWDYDRRVREASHKAHFQLVSKAGRNLAPHLKSLMGPWLMGRCDSHGPAASAANAAFSEAFKGPAKQIDAIVFCKEDILNFLSDVVYNLSVQSLCDSEVCPLEESESTHNRLVSVALLALTLYLNAVPKAEHDKSLDTYSSFLSNPKFWKFSKNKEPSIRAAWFDLMSAFCRLQPSVLELHLARCSPLLLGALDEEDPVVCPLVWDAVLHLIVVHKAAWNHVNVQKAVVPKLWSISKKGFEGNAVVACPNLLPFLSNFPDAVVKEKHHFYSELFGNMIHGLDLPKIQASHSDSSAIVSALIECIRYVATTNPDFEEELVLNHVLPTVESSLIKKNCTLSATPLYALVGDYLTSKRGQHLEAKFWQTVGPSCLSAVDQLDDEESSSSILERLTYMFSCFAGLSLHEGPAASNNSARRKVMFASVDNEDASSKQKKKDILAKKKASCTQLREGPFLELACKLCVAVQERYALENAPDHLEFLAKMVPDFATPLLFRRLLALTDDLDDDQSAESPDHLSKLAMKYFEGPLNRWLHETQNANPDEKDDRIAAALVRIIVRAVLPLIGPQDKASVLSQVCLLRDVTILENLLRTIMRTNDNVNWLKDPVVRIWLGGSTLSTAILAFTKTSIKNTLTSGTTCKQDQASWRLLSLCFESFDDLEPILPMDVLNVILDTLRTAIQELTGTDGSATGSFVVDEVLTLVAELAKGLFSGMPNCWKIAACEDILLAFFLLLCRPLVIAPDTAKVLEDVLTDGTKLLVSNKGNGQLEADGFLYKVCVHIHDIQIKGVTNHLETLSKLFVALLSAVQRALSLAPFSSDDSPLTMDMLDLALLTVDEHRPVECEAVEQNLLDYVMQSELCILSPPPPSSDADVNQSRRNDNHATSVLLASAYLASEGILAVLGEECKFQDRLIPHVIKILFASTYCKVSLRPGNKLVGRAEAVELRKWSPIVDSNLRALLSRLSLKSASKVFAECSRLSQDGGFIWSYAFVELEDHINEIMECASPVDSKKMLASDQNVLSAEASQGALHNVQLHLKADKVDEAFGRSIVRSILDDPDGGNVRCLAVLASAVHLLRRDDVHSVMDMRMVASKCDAVLDVPTEWDQVCLSAQVCRLLAGVVAEHAELLTRDHWDHVLLHLGTWLEKVDVNEQMADRLATPLLATSIFRLSASVSSTMSRLKSAGTLNEDLRTEWDEFFVERIYGRALFLFVTLAEETSSLPCAQEYVLESLAKSLIGIPACVSGLGQASTTRTMSYASGNELPTLLIPDWDDDDQSTPIRVKTALNHLCPLLERRFRAVQYGAYHVLKDLVHSLPKQCDATATLKEDVVVVKEDSKDAAIPGALLATLTHSRFLLEQGPLAERKPGNDDVVLEEHDWPDIVGFLLVWDLVLIMFSQSSSEVRSRNASYLKESGLVQHLLNCLFCLMPNNVALLSASRAEATPPGKNLTLKRYMFTEEPSLDPQAPLSVCDVQHLACSVYLAAVQYIPALVRDWFNGLDRRTSSLVERFTVTNVSPLLCAKDLAAVRLADGAHLLRGLKVRVRPGAREVLATCTVEEISFEIVVRLADNHPLGPITIEAGRPIGVSNSQWSYWTLQLTTFLMHQNGSILDGLLLWKRNIDKKFEGVQECYVCFYVLHGTSYQLPKHLCRTCKKKFHSSCLYKWFSTSGHSTCPLCRSIF